MKRADQDNLPFKLLVPIRHQFDIDCLITALVRRGRPAAAIVA